jgi:virginiamycin B lyase
VARRAANLLACTVVAGVVLVAPAATSAQDATRLLDGVAGGGYVLVFRHAATDFAKPDAGRVVLGDCGTQRNLSSQGRADARAVGIGARRIGLRLGRVLASPYCRTIQTARLAFGRATRHAALLNTIAAAHDAAWRRQIRAASALFARAPVPGTTDVLVTHGSVVTDVSGEVLAEGEALVLRPAGSGRFTVVGRLQPGDWRPPIRRSPSALVVAGLSLREYRVPAGSHPHDVAPAPDGAVWYTAQAVGALGRLDPRTGQTRHIALGEGSAPHGVIVGPDGAPWITDGGLNAIVRVHPKTLAVRRYPLPASAGYANLNTATFDRSGVLWFTGQSGVYGRLDPRTGRMRVFRAPLGEGPYGITTTPAGAIYYASLAGSHIARIDVRTGRATVVRPPTPGQGARRVWSDSHGHVWVSEWNAGRVARYDPAARRWREWRLPGGSPQPYAVYVDDADDVWLTDFGANALVRFDPDRERFDVVRLPSDGADVRQLLGRRGEVWGAESGADKLVVIRRR